MAPELDIHICAMVDSKHTIRRQFNLYPYLNWFWLQRPTEAANVTLAQSYVDAAINGYAGDFIGFQNATEKAQAFHPNIHMMMGGDMAGACPTAAGSSCIGGSTWTPNDVRSINPILIVRVYVEADFEFYLAAVLPSPRERRPNLVLVAE